jgi:hypothetical protein
MRFLTNILAKAGLIVDGTTQLNTIANATVDTDKFLVSDGGVVKYRTAPQLVADLGPLPSSILRHQVKLGEAINKGQAVYVSSADGTNMIVSKASNVTDLTSSKTLGLIETSGVTNDQVNVVTEGLLAGLDTSTATAGDPVWLGTNGNLIFGLVNKPSAPAHLVFIGVVTRVQSNNGEIFVKVQNGFEMEELHNVAISSIANKNLLMYEAATSLWKNKTLGNVIGGTSTQYVKGDGTLGSFPDIGGGGGLVYYLNGSVSSGVAGYSQMSKTPVIGAGTDFSKTGDGLICQFLTDVNDPSLLSVPSGAWRFGLYASMGSAGNSSKFYVEVFKYDGTTFTLIGSSSGTPESVDHGTATEYYTTTVAMSTTALTVTDRIAVKIYATDNNTRTMTIHTENSNLCDIATTFPSGIASINGLITPSQYLSTTTTGTDFTISSSSNTHYFNLPVASATITGKLSSTDWSTFNNKQNALGYTPVNQTRSLTINGVTYDLSSDRTWSVGTVTSVGLSVPTGFSVSNTPVTGSGTIGLSFTAGYSLPTTASQSNWDVAYTNRITSLTTTGTSGAATLVSNVLNIPQYQAQGSYITSLTGEATASGPGSASVTLSTSAVTGKVLTGLNVTGGTVLATDSILTAFGKLQNQVNGLAGGVTYQGAWNASTNSPSLTSSVGTKGYYYVVSVAGSTNLNGITDWKLGDWAIFNGTAWEKVDNTDAVVSVNGFTGAVSLTTSNISEGTNLYYTDARARAAISLTTTGSSGAATYSNLTGVLNIPQYTLSGLGGVPTSRQLTINGTSYDLSADRTWTITNISGTAAGETLATVTGRGASTSSDLTFNGTLTMGTGGTQYIRMGRFPASVTNTGEAWIGRASDRVSGTMTVQLGGNSASGRNFEVVDYAWSAVLFNVSSGGSVTASADMRAPIFYDSANTTYYLDPASTSNLNGLTTNGQTILGGQIYVSSTNSNTLNSGYGVNGSADIWINYRGYNDGFTQWRNFNIGDGKGNNILWADAANKRVSINNGQSASHTLHVAGTGFASSDFRAPIFYDSDNTSYYLDPNNTGTALVVAGSVGIDNTAPSVKLEINTPFAGYTGFTGSSKAARFNVTSGSGQCTALLLTQYLGDVGSDTTVDIDFAAIDSNSVLGSQAHARIGYTAVYNPLVNTSNIYEARGYFRIATRGEDTTGTLVDRFLIDHTGTVRLLNYTTNGFVKFSNSDGTLAVDTNSYATTTGGGATGTWGISITGTAAGETLATVTGRGATTSSNLTLSGGNKIVIQNGTDGTSARGLFLWTAADTNWGIYMAQAGALKSLANGTASSSIDGQVSHHIRFRVGNGSDNGFIWENNTEQALMSLKGNNGNLYTRGQIYAGNSTSNLVLHTGNYNSYAPTLTGGGASGTWGISITGSAGSVAFNNLTSKTGGTGTYQTSGDFRAPIFYDSDNTAYYLDPNSNSNLNTLTLNQINYTTSYNGRYTEWYCGIGTGPASGGNRYEVARIGIDFNDWNSVGTFEVELQEVYYYAGCRKRYVVSYGYGGPVIRCDLVEVNGSGNFGNFRVIVGSEVVVSGDWRYIPIYVDAQSYTQVAIKVRTTRQITNSTVPEVGYAKIFTSSSASSISSFGTDSTVYLTSNQVGIAAPIYYDSDNTSYYLDPAGTSNIRKTNIVAIGQSWDDGLNLYSADATNRWNVLVDNGASDMLRFAFNNAEKFRVQTDGVVIATGDFRAPIFYDSANTAYYGDFAGTSILNGLTVNTLSVTGATYLPNNALLSINGESDVWGARFRTTTSTTNLGAQLKNIIWCGGGASEGLAVKGVYAGAPTAFEVRNDGIVWASSSFRAPIFYDSDDTTYFADLASTNTSIYTAGIIRSSGVQVKGSSTGGQIYPTMSNGGVSLYGGNSFTNGAYFTVTGIDYASSPGAGSAEFVIRNTATSKFALFSYNGSTWTGRYGLFGSTGNVTIGDANTDIGYRLYVIGDIYATGNIIANSDARIKTNIREIENPLARVLNTKGVIYDRIDIEENNSIGFIAQELEKEFPELVSTSTDGRKGVKYQNMVAVLVEAMKEQQKQIDILQSLINK